MIRTWELTGVLLHIFLLLNQVSGEQIAWSFYPASVAPGQSVILEWTNPTKAQVIQAAFRLSIVGLTSLGQVTITVAWDDTSVAIAELVYSGKFKEPDFCSRPIRYPMAKADPHP